MLTETNIAAESLLKTKRARLKDVIAELDDHGAEGVAKAAWRRDPLGAICHICKLPLERVKQLQQIAGV